MRKFIAYIIFIIVQILFIPFAIIGALIVYYKQTFISKKLGASATAIEILNGRWAMDRFGIREDTAAVQLMKVLPNTSPFGLWMALAPMYLLKVIAGQNLIYPVVKEPGKETIADLVTARTRFFDNILQRTLKDSEQFVVMGAGLDTRCYGALKHSNLALFEMDQSNTQKLKIDALKKANIDMSNVHFVEVDFTKDSWHDKLQSARFDDKKKTTFLWEGVTLYLSEQDVRNTLKEIRKYAVPGSVVVVDFYAMKFVNGELFPGMKSGIKSLKITDEELGFGIPFENNDTSGLSSLVESENFKLGEVHYMGKDTKKGIWMAVAELVV